VVANARYSHTASSSFVTSGAFPALKKSMSLIFSGTMTQRIVVQVALVMALVPKFNLTAKHYDAGIQFVVVVPLASITATVNSEVPTLLLPNALAAV